MLICGLVGLATAANMLLKQNFFEAVGASASDLSELHVALWWGVFLGLFTVTTLAVQGASDILLKNLGYRLSAFLGRSVNDKAGKVDPICFENEIMLDDINKAYKGVQDAGDVVRISMFAVAFYVPYLAFLVVYLFRFEPILSYSVMLVFIPIICGRVFRTRTFTKFENTAAPIRRRAEYYEKCINEREYAKETRLLGATWFFRTLLRPFLSAKGTNENEKCQTLSNKVIE